MEQRRLTTEEMKLCSRCKESLPVADFYVRRAHRTGYAPWCKDCEREANRPRHERRHRASIKYRYGLSPAEYSAMWEQQGGLCRVCGSPEVAIQAGKLRRLSVDHSHETGEVRGLLCQKCNAAIGLANDSAGLLRKMAEYLDGCA